VSLFSPADVVQLRGVAELAFHDDYRVMRKNADVVRDPMNNRVNSTGADYRTVEAQKGNLRRSGLQPGERIIADRLGWTVAYAFDLPLDTLAQPQDRLEVDDVGTVRVFHIGGVIREGALALVATAIVEERSH